MFKTILFFLVLFLVIKIISNLYLSNNKKNSKARFFYKTYKNVRNQQKKQKEKQQQNKDPNERLDDIEEAEYEDVTENENDSKKK